MCVNTHTRIQNAGRQKEIWTNEFWFVIQLMRIWWVTLVLWIFDWCKSSLNFVRPPKVKATDVFTILSWWIRNYIIYWRMTAVSLGCHLSPLQRARCWLSVWTSLLNLYEKRFWKNFVLDWIGRKMQIPIVYQTHFVKMLAMDRQCHQKNDRETSVSVW